MSEATDRPDESGAAHAYDDDAWATACEEDLAAERARRRAQYGPQTGSAAEELRRLMDAVADKVSSLQSPLFGMAAQSVANQFVQQAKAVVEPVVERNPQVFDHLAAAGNELLAAYRSVVAGHEQRWTQNASDAAKTPNRTDNSAKSSQSGPDDPDDRSKGEHIDLD
ncbi:hypothetical protein GCM10010329_13070 [Streptomyces spiroverticillatus]|uniref:DUF5304 domain-containing protein n=1 Tax=Streptomyces finlayi TaxID=67296 RepID=A0A918WWY1_9ACTN|nr:DUF5304 domain-containing protein [Streptomyces finlayi]GGZ93452.1 hypothetical protein GCM10010329_13070 [Streptomyces spiroverticillatus]GHC92314.1 hypothetical protein GCM10010334_28030 [Streptomyces finlayi]